MPLSAVMRWNSKKSKAVPQMMRSLMPRVESTSPRGQERKPKEFEGSEAKGTWCGGLSRGRHVWGDFLSIL